MKNALVVVGKRFQHNPIFFDYIKREASSRIGALDLILFLAENDKNILLELDKIIKESDNLLVVVSRQAYATVAKVVSTITDDRLILKDDMLLPSKTSRHQNGSFLVESEGRQINLIQAEENGPLPEILLSVEKEHATLYVLGKETDEVMRELAGLAQTYDILVTPTTLTKEFCTVLAQSKRYGQLLSFVEGAKATMPMHLIATDNIFAYLIEKLDRSQKKLTLAESCTGGLLASLITKEPGASNIYEGSLITYSNRIKTAWLGVRNETLKEHGAVSKETILEMLRGALKVSEADFAIAISGIAGPTGATPNKPVGTVFVGVANQEDARVEKMLFEGDRNYIQIQAAYYAIKLLFEFKKEIFLNNL